MAFRRKLGNLAGILFQSRLRQQDQERQYDLQRRNQEASSKAQFNNQAFEKVLSDPTGDIADRLTKAGMGGFEGFIPSNTDIQGRLGEGIANTNDPTKLDDPMSLIAKFRSAPGAKYDPSMRQPIEELINQTNQRREAIKNNSPLQTTTEALDDGSKQLRSYNPQNMDQPIQTQVSAQTEGQNKFTERTENELNPIAINTEVSKAGRTAYAQGYGNQTGQNKAQSEYVDNGGLQRELNIRTQSALAQAQSQAEGAAIVKSTEGVARFMPSVLELSKKWKQAQPEIEALINSGKIDPSVWDNIQASGLQALPMPIQNSLSPTVRQYFEMRQTFMPIYARMLGEVGNLAEQEQVRASGLAPSALDALQGGKSGTEKLDRLQSLLVNMPDVQLALFRMRVAGTPPEQQSQAIDQLITRGRTPEAPVDPALAGARQELQRLLGGR